MNFTSIIVLGILFTLLLYTLCYIDIKNNQKISFLSWFFLGLGTINGLGFIFVYWGTIENMNLSLWNKYLEMYTVKDVIDFYFSNIILVISVYIGYTINLKKKLNNYTVLKINLGKFKKINLGKFKKINLGKFKKINLGKFKKIIYKIKEINLFKKYYYLACIFLMISFICYGVYVIPYGGFIELLDHSLAIRSGISKINNPFSFLQRFGGFSFFASFLFFGLILSKNHISKKLYILFLISIIFSIYVLLSWSGRVALIVYLLTFLLAYKIQKEKNMRRFFTHLLILFGIAGIGLFIANSLMSRGSNHNILTMFVKELSFPYVSYIANINYNNDFRFFQDILHSPLFILPQRIWSSLFNIDTASTINTILILGAKKGENNVTSTIPVDIITFSFMQLSNFGIIIIGLFWGKLTKTVECLVEKITIPGIKSCLSSYLILNLIILTIIYSDPLHIITRNFHLIVGGVSLIIISKKALNNYL